MENAGGAGSCSRTGRVPGMSDVLEALAGRAQSVWPMLERWVEQNSFTGAVDNVNAMGELLKAAFRLPGLELSVQPGKGVGDHLLFSTPAWQAHRERGVLLVGHHDTVFPPGTFEGFRADGDLRRGPGVLDMKGGLAVVWASLAALSDADRLAELPVALVCVGDEEIGSPDSRSFTAEHARGCHAALVFEAGRAADAIITQRKGTAAVKVVAHGKAAHAGNHHADGVNAIWALARFVDQAQGLTDYAAGVTLNVGTISGGTSKNTVPERAECAVDFRFERVDDGPRVLARLQTIAEELGADSGVRFELDGGVRRPPLERTEASAALCQRYAEQARAAGLGHGEHPLLGGGSDANNIAALGVPAIDGLGPRGKGFHTHDEVIEASTLPLKAQALTRFLLAELGA